MAATPPGSPGPYSSLCLFPAFLNPGTALCLYRWGTASCGFEHSVWSSRGLCLKMWNKTRLSSGAGKSPRWQLSHLQGPFCWACSSSKYFCFLHHAVGATSVPQGAPRGALHGPRGIREVLWVGATAKKPLQT